MELESLSKTLATYGIHLIEQGKEQQQWLIFRYTRT
jgi:hypothetical protein